MRKTLALAGAAAAVIMLPTSAQALPVVTIAGDAQQTVGTAHTYDGSGSICDIPPCRYQWRYYRTTGTDRLGTTMGEGEKLTYTFTNTGTFRVVLKVILPTSTHGYSTNTFTVTIAPVVP